MTISKLVVGAVALALLGTGCAPRSGKVDTRAQVEVQAPAPAAPATAPAPTPAPAPAPAPVPAGQKGSGADLKVDTKARAEVSAPKTLIVRISSIGFNPSDITIKVGDTVKFVNEESVPHWPASGMHPTHQICPGFDSLRGLDTGESYSFTFREAKTCPFHDHLNASMRGSITVQ